jgi:protein-S-isoprenylcysteine O-methyltransferase Ste14
VQRAWDMAGAAFFRARSFAPLPIIGLVIWLSWRAHINPGPGGATVDAVLNGVGLLTCLGGALVRLLTIASVPAGTSSQSRTMQSHALNTSGPYAAVRHPLYLGNGLITTGLLCIAHDPWAWVFGLGYYALSHVLIIRAEEALLRRTFGAEYDAWASQVPALLPKFSKLSGFFAGPFAWKRAVQREVNPLVGWGMGATLLLMWERFARSELTTANGKLGLSVLAAFLVLLIANKVWKKVSRA